MTRRKFVPARVNALLHNEAAPGVLLMVVAALAMIVANSPLDHWYHDLFHGRMNWTPVAKLNTLHLWVNDGLMALFFFVVGLEIKREVTGGALARAETRRLPIIAAVAGMAAPAAVYLYMVAGEGAELARGWAIPAATDIAFAMGVLALLGKRIPPALRLFLLTVAIVDDIGAVMIIAVAYTASIKGFWLITAMLLFGGMVALNRFKVERALPYAALALALWFAVLNSGVHATIAGVLAALTIPNTVGKKSHDCLLLRMEHALVPWSGFLIVPLFGFANAGVALGSVGTEGLLAPLPLAIALGLFLGKQVGIMGSLFVAHKVGAAGKLEGTTWIQLWGMSLLCGIGFTMSLFIGALAFPLHPLLVEEAKLGVLGGSLLAASLGYLVLRFAPAGQRALDAANAKA